MATAPKADSVSTSWRLASLTKGMRGRIVLAALFGLGAVTTRGGETVSLRHGRGYGI